jgi:hypothetical protein
LETLGKGNPRRERGCTTGFTGSGCGMDWPFRDGANHSQKSFPRIGNPSRTKVASPSDELPIRGDMFGRRVDFCGWPNPTIQAWTPCKIRAFRCEPCRAPRERGDRFFSSLAVGRAYDKVEARFKTLQNASQLMSPSRRVYARRFDERILNHPSAQRVKTLLSRSRSRQTSATLGPGALQKRFSAWRFKSRRVRCPNH